MRSSGLSTNNPALNRLRAIALDPGILYVIGHVMVFSMGGGLLLALSLASLATSLYLQFQPLPNRYASLAINGLFLLGIGTAAFFSQEYAIALFGYFFGLGNLLKAIELDGRFSPYRLEIIRPRWLRNLLHPEVFRAFGLLTVGWLAGGATLFFLPLVAAGLIAALSNSGTQRPAWAKIDCLAPALKKWPHLTDPALSLTLYFCFAMINTVIGTINGHYLAAGANISGGLGSARIAWLTCQKHKNDFGA